MKNIKITIVGIALILIAIAVISVVRSHVDVPSTEVHESVAVNVDKGLVEQAGQVCVVRREVVGEVDVPTSVSAVQQVRGMTRTVGVMGRNFVQREGNVLAVAVVRAAVKLVPVSRVEDVLG